MEGMAESQTAPLQTLSRGITALEVLAEAEVPLSITELAGRLGLHRSITYRIVRTLEEHRLVVRDSGGDVKLGTSLASLARNVSRDLQAAALPEVTELANDLGMTAFVAVHDCEDAVTLVSVEPRVAIAAVAQRPGTRHPLGRGAPGRAVRRLVGGVGLATRDTRDLPYETSHDEVIQGLSSIAVPLDVPGQQPGAIAVVYLTGPADVAMIGQRLVQAARTIRDCIR
jgi:DNA-binding IclR family transcriptional regulator